jgi:hypothetical protein
MAVAGSRPSMHTPPATAVDANHRTRRLRRQQNLDGGGCPDEGVRRTAFYRSLPDTAAVSAVLPELGRLAMPSRRLVSTADTAAACGWLLLQEAVAG